MRVLVSILSLFTLPAFAEMPWLAKIGTCTAALSPHNERAMALGDTFTLPANGSDQAVRLFGPGATAFMGTQDGKPGLWIVSPKKAHFIDLDNVQTQNKGGRSAWHLRVTMPNQEKVRLAFGYLERTKRDGNVYYLPQSAVVETDTNKIAFETLDPTPAEVSAKEYLTDDLREQMEKQVLGTLETINDMYAPRSGQSPAKKTAEIGADDRKKLDDLLKDFLPPPPKAKPYPTKPPLPKTPQWFKKSDPKNKLAPDAKMADLIRKLIDDGAAEMVANLRKCQTAIKGDPKFSNINGLVTLTIKYIENSRGNLDHYDKPGTETSI